MRRAGAGSLLVTALLTAPLAAAQDAVQWLTRVANAARTLNYTGTIVNQYGGRIETSRIVHLSDNGQEWEKLTSLDGPAREVIRNSGEVRCYFPDEKVVRVEARTLRNVFPSLSAEQIRNLAQHYEYRRVSGERIAGHAAEIVVFEPNDGLRYGHRFWVDGATGLLLKASLVSDKGETVEQVAFTDVVVNARIDRDMVKPSWAQLPPDWQVKQMSSGEFKADTTGWSVSKLPPGFTKISEGYRKWKGKPEPVAQIVFSDGLVEVSVFIEPVMPKSPTRAQLQHGGLNYYSIRSDDQLVTVLGKVPPATVRQIAQSVARR
jgi:sigma-E factor negative regulatory protein RseB